MKGIESVIRYYERMHKKRISIYHSAKYFHKLEKYKFLLKGLNND